MRLPVLILELLVQKYNCSITTILANIRIFIANSKAITNFIINTTEVSTTSTTTATCTPTTTISIKLFKFFSYEKFTIKFLWWKSYGFPKHCRRRKKRLIYEWSVKTSISWTSWWRKLSKFHRILSLPRPKKKYICTHDEKKDSSSTPGVQNDTNISINLSTTKKRPFFTYNMLHLAQKFEFQYK